MTNQSPTLRDAFLEDHRSLTTGLSNLLQALEDGDLREATRMADDLDQVAGPHMTFEEEVFYPELARILGPEFIERLYGEHEAGGTSWLYLAPKHSAFGELGFLELGDAAPPVRTERIQHGIFKYFVPPLAWYGLLGAAMWVSRPDAHDAGSAPAQARH